ncbi:MAG: hypothetical protein ACRD2N_03585 [Vicinamibacterales bacterium]
MSSALNEPKPDSPWWHVVQHGSRLVDFCVRTTDLQADVAVFARRA